MTPYRDPAITRTNLTRRLVRTAVLLLVAATFAAASIGFTLMALSDDTGDPFLPALGAMLAGASALGLVIGPVLRGSGEAPCPSCGARVHDLERKGEIEGILCTACGRFLRSADGTLRAMGTSTIADTPLFGMAVTREVTWLPGCVVCGEPATQVVPLSIFGAEAAARAAIALYSGTGGLAVAGESARDAGDMICLEAPHCAAHDDGASLVRGGPTGAVLLLRSLPYHHVLCEVNGAVAVESPELGRGDTVAHRG